ncbi:MAG: hypothetical protein ABJP42_03685, partial [Pseudophaeobacter sp.]
GIALAILGALAAKRPALALWAPLMPLYYLMGPIAAYKALYELLYDPFFWDKTCHGVHPPDKDAQAHRSPRPVAVSDQAAASTPPQKTSGSNGA